MVNDLSAVPISDLTADISDSHSVENSIGEQMRALEHLVDRLTASWVSGEAACLNRRLHRAVFEEEIAIVAVSDGDLTPVGEPRRVRTCDISQGGISFEHRHPISCRMIVATFPPFDETAACLLVRLKWCRFTRAGIYRSGGQFLRNKKPRTRPEINLHTLCVG